MIREFVEYTLREVNFNLEADNADTFRANFRDMKQVVFPMIFRQYSGTRVLCMSFLKGDKPNSEKVRQLPLYERERLIDIGAEAIIRMIYRDGFFHADLHPGNLIVLEDGRCGFIDLGMVGRFDDELRRKLLYYYYCLVIGDPNNAARYLADLADRDSKSDPKGFMRATTDLSRRWHSHSNFKEFSLAQLVMASVALGAQYRMYFPVEMVLMVKALVTYEGVGNYLKPGFDVARVSKKHITGLFFHQFNPANLFTEHLRLAPDMLDAYLKFPLLVTESFKYLRKRTQVPDPPVNRGLRETVLSSAFIISGTILAAVDQAWWTFVPLFVLGFFFVFHRSD
jgi:ubiquinone biosynthesis protein